MITLSGCAIGDSCTDNGGIIFLIIFVLFTLYLKLYSIMYNNILCLEVDWLDKPGSILKNTEAFSQAFYEYTEKIRALNFALTAKRGNPYRFYTETFGCQQNEKSF